uniref:Putative ovule protein n=1 Tax=Solanum chacoense TaxID=4108 RepID=A0A0V0GXS0_SOLCH
MLNGVARIIKILGPRCFSSLKRSINFLGKVQVPHCYYSLRKEKKRKHKYPLNLSWTFSYICNFVGSYYP